jgi:endonuclease/exonuclease/phosphatase family metal-dependent hydrolase
MKLLTQNIWNYNRPWPVRRSLLADIIRAHAPDVIGLQETRHDWRFAHGLGQGEQLAADTGYVATSRVAQVYLPILRIDEGLTTMTKEPPERVVCRRLSQNPHEREDENRRICLGVSLNTPGGSLDVYNTHFSLSPRVRERSAHEVAEFIEHESGNRPAVLLGDLNAHPEDPPLRFLLEEAGFVDCWAAAHPNEDGFTDPSWAPHERIDYILVRHAPAGAALTAELVGAATADGIHASDHLGLLVDISLP